MILTVGSTLHVVEKGTFIVDPDIGEMFLNFVLSEVVRLFCGVNVKNVQTE